MKGFTHFYARYGLALTLTQKKATSLEDLTAAEFSELLESGLLNFRIKAVGSWKGQDKIEYQYARLQKGEPSVGIFLSPSILTSDQSAQKLWVKIEDFKTKLSATNIDFYKKEAANQSFVPTAGEYTNGKNSRQTADIPFVEAVCCAITTTTTEKPTYTSFEKGGKPLNNAIFPDLPLDELRHFITVFGRVSKFKTENLMEGKVSRKEEKKVVVEKPSRPALTRGNFPNAPKSNSLRAMGLLGAIGEWAKESDDTGLGPGVLKSLETCPIYLVSPDATRITNFNHFVVKLARENRLSSIIDSIHRVAPFSLSRKSDFKEKEREQEKVAFFAARFLHLFDEMSFREFLAVRAEYPPQLEILFKTFFMEKKQIDPRIVRSAKSLGSWLNYVAYKVAAAESKEKVRELKAKVLVELESSAFASKSGTALIAQTITRAGRLSQMDAPAEAELFMEKTMSGELDLKDAQQMLMAFSRLRNKYEPKNTVLGEDFSGEPTGEAEDFADAQDND
jgi:hypothetical protein